MTQPLSPKDDRTRLRRRLQRLMVFAVTGTLVFLFAALFRLEWVQFIGQSRCRVLFHDGAIVVGYRGPLNPDLGGRFLCERATNPMDFDLLPSLVVQLTSHRFIEVGIPFSIPTLFMWLYAGVLWGRIHRPESHQCQACGYDRTGLDDTANCPECGQPR
ncbi:MAG: hypothetical protein KC983_05450 [Phycisphaerales bacterium]|nr:hypothetical protein [Phycisphaerales bacterium]